MAGAPAPPGALFGGEPGAGAGLGTVGLGPGTVGLGLGMAGDGPGTPPGDGAELPGAGAPDEPGGGKVPEGGTVSDGGVPIGGDVLGGGSALPGAAFPGAGAAGASAGTDCGGTVGPAAGVTLCTATRTFSMSESTSSSVKLGRPRGSLTSTFAPSPSCTLKRSLGNCELSARRMLRATESSLAPDITATVTSTGSLPSVAVMRNARSPLEAALPEVAMFQTPADGGAEAA